MERKVQLVDYQIDYKKTIYMIRHGEILFNKLRKVQLH